MKLSSVYDSTELSSRNVYQIDGTLYRFLRKDGSINHPQFHFSPLAGQRKKSDIKLNHQKLLTRCQLVQGMTTNAEVIGKAIQLSLI